MRFKSVCFYTSMVLTVFLFVCGIYIISYIINESVMSSETVEGPAIQQYNGNILRPFITDRKPFNILLLGGDKVNNNSDTMILVNFDPNTYTINLMSIPRDTRVIINNTSHAINFAYPHAGAELSAKTVSELLNVKIKYYIYLDTSAFRRVVDILGGVDIDVPFDMDWDAPDQNLYIHLKKGYQHLNGDQAEQYVRFRKPNHWTAELRRQTDGSDLARIRRQQDFLRELISQKLNIQYFSSIDSILDVIYENIETNLSLNEILNLTGIMNKLNMQSFNFIELPGITIDKSPYFFCNADKGREIARIYFPCGTSFVDTGGLHPERYKGTGIAGMPIEKEAEDTAKGNPSNADSSIKGGEQPEP